jgi:hypothetical protein
MMAIAEHAPSELYARNKGAAKMTKSQLHDFASTKESKLPMRKEKHAPHNPGRIEHVHMHLQTPTVAPDRGMDMRGEPHLGPVAGTMPGHVHHGLMKFYHGKATSK